MEIILICVGIFQDYILYNIKNLLLFGNSNITVICDKIFFEKFINLNVKLVNSDNLSDLNYSKNSKFNNFNFKITDNHSETVKKALEKLNKRKNNKNFWYLCSLRLFLLYSYIYKNNIKDCIHIENDVLIYSNLKEIEIQLKKSKKLLIPMDHQTRAVLSFIFIPSFEHLKPVIDNYNHQKNDMENLAIFYHKFDNIDILPLLDSTDKQRGFLKTITAGYNRFGCIFDGAAIGQYLGGTDKGKGLGFINETCVINYSKYLFKWKKNNNLYRPYIIVNNKEIPIINLHIHSKQLQNFMGILPKENNLIKYI